MGRGMGILGLSGELSSDGVSESLEENGTDLLA